MVFIEHDCNPTKDLQAMDRAHRIGQKKQSVYLELNGKYEYIELCTCSV